jgi:hypothetical protein
MNITYTYEIISVDQQARCMEVVYTAEGYQTLHIGARLPYEGETLEAIVQMYAPVRYWEEQNTPVVTVNPGQTGSVQILPPVVPSAAETARRQRNHLLTDSDWTQLSDASIGELEKTEWLGYRQALRDLPSQTGFPDTIVWPLSPGLELR